MRQSDHKSYLKVVYKQKHGKYIDLTGLTYQKLIAKLIKGFNLSMKNSIYHLYYLHEQDCITVRCEQDFAIFLKLQKKKKLYLTPENDATLHFTIKFKSSQNQVKQQNIQEIISQKEVQLIKKIQKNKNILRQKLLEEMSQKYREMMKPRHKNISCKNCMNGQDIIGIRYQCTICDYNICQNCQIDDDHPHPLIKILNPLQALAKKQNIMLSNKQCQNYERAMIEKNKLIENVVQFLGLSRDKARQFIDKNPNKTIQELLEIYFA